MVQHQQQLGCR